MKLIINIPEGIYKASKIINVQYEDVIQIPLEVIANGIPIPDNATNGDVIKTMFPNISIYEHGSTYSVNNEYNFNSTWWKAPYRAESEDK